MYRVLLILTGLVLTLSSCNEREEFLGHTGAGKAPVYLPISELDDISSQPAQAVEEGGPIFLIGDFFFMVEARKGIHVFDVSDDQQESSLVFIKIPAITDFTIDENILFADSWKDLVSIDITDIFNVVLLSRTKDVFDPFLFPQLFNGPFECFDESRGAIVGWEDRFLQSTFCHTLN